MSVYFDTGLLLYCCFLAVVIGLVMGSFLNCAAWRIAHGESFLRGRSHCPECGHPLGAADLVPVFSWLFLKGRCRYCGAPVSARYPLTELLFALISLSCLLQGDLTVLTARNFVFACCLFCLSLVDLECMEIPDGCLILSAAAWVLTAPLMGITLGQAVSHVLAGLVYGGGLLALSLLMDRLLKKESMGGGDIKLLAVMGLYLGWVSTLFAVVLACLLGLGLALLRRRVSPENEAFPFGPALSAACWLMLLYGQPLADWYLSLL